MALEVNNNSTTTPNSAPENVLSPMNVGRLDTIREILFGQQVQEYDSQFKEMQLLVQKQRIELDDKMTSLHKQLLETINALHRDLSHLIQKNHEFTLLEIQRIDHEKTNRVEIGKMMVQLGQQLIQDGKANT